MREQTIGGFLEQLAARVPAPGGGATAALHVAQGAALLGMVARYSTGDRYLAHAAAIERIRDEADRLRRRALQLAEDDAAAFTTVAGAYRLPGATEAERAARSTAIASRLVGAARPPADTIAAARLLVALAEELLPVGNRSVISDVAAAAEAARAALTTARLNLEVNLRGITDPTARTELADDLAGVDAHVARAERVTETVRQQIAG
jgi:methenyltetrahydrofolate cyclohydrolase